MTKDDRYFVEITPHEQVYLYIAQIDGNGILDPVFPNPSFSSKLNPVMANMEYRFPESDNFYLSGITGREEYIYLIASVFPNQILDAIFDRIQRKTDQSSSIRLSSEFLDIFNKQDPSCTKKVWFWHK